MTAYQNLILLCTLLNMPEPETITEYEDDATYSVEIVADGKLILSSEIGFGDTLEEALNDAAERFFSYTPTLDSVPVPKLLKLLNIYDQIGPKERI